MAPDVIQVSARPGCSQTTALVNRLFPPPRPFAVRLWDGTSLAVADASFTLVLNHPGALRRMFMPPIKQSVSAAFVSGDIEIEGDHFVRMPLNQPFEHFPLPLRQ